jgi:hypothetical protein
VPEQLVVVEVVHVAAAVQTLWSILQEINRVTSARG